MTLHVLERIALLIRENPSITVQEIATRLGYSEEKSIYYWLEKSRYSGIKDFKKAVLTGEYRSDEPATVTDPQDSVREPDTFLLYPTTEIPLIKEFTSSGLPMYVERQTIIDHAQRLEPGSFAYACNSNEYAPLILRGDLIIVDPISTPTSSDLLMLWLPPATILLRRYYGTADRSIFIHPVTGQDLLIESPAAQPRIVGKLLHLIRSF